MAGTIDQLNFEVILNDASFKKTVDTDIALAKKLNSSLSKVLTIKTSTKQIISSTGVKNAKEMAFYLDEIAKKIKSMPKGSFLVGDADQLNKTLSQVSTQLDQIINKQKKHSSAVGSTNSGLLTTGNILRTLSRLTGATFSVIGLRRFLSSLIDITGQFEVQRMALRNMLQDIEGADKIYQDLYRFSSDSTYRFSELAKYAKQLAAFNIDKDSLLETTKMLGDVASGVGVSMDRVILAYGHVKSSGFLRGIQLRSFSQNGIPVLEELSKILTEIEGKTVSLGDVFDRMMKREVTFEMVEQAFKNMTAEGGKFYQMQEVLAKTLAGQINILKGRWENMLAAIGQSQDGLLKGIVGDLSSALLHYEKIGKAVAELISTYGAYRVALFMVRGAAAGLTVAETVQLGVMELLNKTILANPYALLAASIVAVTAAIYKMVDGMKSATEIQEVLRKEQSKFATDLSTSINELELLYGKLKLAAEGSEQYNAAVRAIQSRYGEYIKQLKDEGVEVGNLALVYDNLRKKVEDSARARFIASATSSLDEQYGQDYAKIMDKNGRYTIQRIKSQLNLNAKEEGFLKMWVGGLYSKEDLQNLDEAGSLLEKINGAYVSLGSGDSGPVKAADYIDELSDRVKNLNKDYNDAKGVIEEFANALAPNGTGGGGEQDERVYRISSIIDGIKAFDKDIKALRDKAKNGSITQTEKDQLDKLVGLREDQAKIYKEIMGVDYDKDVRASNKSVEDAVKSRMNEIKAEIARLEKYKSAFDRLFPFFGDQTGEKLNAFDYYNDVDFSNLDQQIRELLEILRSLGEEGEEAAQTIEARLGIDAVSKIEKHQRALEKYQKTLRKWMSEDFNLAGTGFEFDMNKVFSDLNTKIGAIQERYVEAVKEAKEAHEGDADAIAMETNNLLALRDAEIEYERTKAQESLNNLAESYLKDQYFLRGISMDNLSGLSLTQLSTLKKELREIGKDALNTGRNVASLEGFLKTLGIDVENLTDEDIESLKDKLPESTIEMVRFMKAIKDTGLSFDMLNEKIQAAIKKGLKKLDDSEKKAIGRLAKYAASQVLSLADSFRELGDATGNSGMKDAADGLSDIADVVKNISAGFQAGGWYGAIIAGIVSITKKIVDAQTELKKIQNTIIDIRVEAQRASFDDILSGGVEGIFGNDSMRHLQNAISGIDELKDKQAELNDALAEFRKIQEKTTEMWYNGQYDGPGANAAFVTKKSYWGGLHHQFKSLTELAKEFNMELYDRNGNLNPQLLQAVLDAYGKLNAGSEKWLKNAIAYAEEYESAIKVVEETLKSVFGEIASSAADSIIDGWIEAGNAALDYADIIDDVAKKYAKMLVESALLKDVLNPEEAERVARLFTEGRHEEAMAAIAEDMEKIRAMEPTLTSILSSFEPYFKRDNGDTSDSLGAGIKAITEDQAGLLASYLNAIRADVSYERGLMERGVVNVELLGAAIPTLNDHIAQIAATNQDIAQSNQSILSELRSAIGSPGSTGMVVRIEPA